MPHVHNFSLKFCILAFSFFVTETEEESTRDDYCKLIFGECKRLLCVRESKDSDCSSGCFGRFYALKVLQYVQNLHWQRPGTCSNNSVSSRAISAMYMPILKIYLLYIANLLKQVYQVYFAISKK